MSPLMAKVKCPHERGPDLNESETIAEGSGDEFGRSWEDYAEGGSKKDRKVLPASQANLEKSQGKRSGGTLTWKL